MNVVVVVVVVVVGVGVETVTQSGSWQMMGQKGAAPSRQSCTTSAGSICWRMRRRAQSGIWGVQGAKVVVGGVGWQVGLGYPKAGGS